MRPIKLYWCRGSGRSDESKQNFGDYLSSMIVEMVSNRRVVYSNVKSADMIAIGSILDRTKKAKILGIPRRLHVWGAGSGKPLEVYSSRHHYHAVRGQKCMEQIRGLSGSPVFGDPGLLASLLVKRPSVKKFKVGIIPHISHRNSPAIAFLQSRYAGSKIIDVYSPVRQVLEEIGSCDFVLSTSLHGLIVADSYGVPNQWLCIERNPHWEFKFYDYYSGVGVDGACPVTPKKIRLDPSWSIDECIGNYSRPNLETIQDSLVRAFPQL
ncbi:polysaccharide pyruvyl transferase family protein [Pseudomonas putida]|uniref:polysaccharide pyruvyl transferase family protein n=1 Tax=Pseudomonas putida TaxID=303 RepID=UPI0021185BC6